MRETKVEFLENTFVVSFKRRHSGRLKNIQVAAVDVRDASTQAKQYLTDNHITVGPKGWREYGVSRATRILYKSIQYGADGVFEVWYTDPYTYQYRDEVSRRQLSIGEVRELMVKKT